MPHERTGMHMWGESGQDDTAEGSRVAGRRGRGPRVEAPRVAGCRDWRCRPRGGPGAQFCGGRIVGAFGAAIATPLAPTVSRRRGSWGTAAGKFWGRGPAETRLLCGPAGTAWPVSGFG